MQKRTSKVLKSKNTGEDAVSPVVGVMLLLVVTVIIAAVVATFASGLVTTQQTVPTMSADVKITSLDTYKSMGGAGKFEMEIIAVSEPILTKNLKIVTSYTATNRTDSTKKVNVGATVYGNKINVNYTGSEAYKYVAPIGFGPGVQGTVVTSGNYGENQWFGNYALTEGTWMQSSGAYKTKSNSNSHTDGQNSYVASKEKYEPISAPNDGKSSFTAKDVFNDMNSKEGMSAILGSAWKHLQPGDVVDVTIIHIPTNGVLFSEKVMVK